MKRKVSRLVVVAVTGAVIGMLMLESRSRAGGMPPVDAAATFKTKCAACHGADGSGETAAGRSLKVRDLRSAEVQNQSDAQLYDLIAKGKGKMPPYEKTLGADTCKALVSFLRHLKK